jgi:hypothetical protein
MRQMRMLILVLACLLVVCGVPAASAQERIVPANNSAISQFLTTVPGPAGDERLPRDGDTGLSPALSTRKRELLERLGPEGKTTIDLLERTAPAGIRSVERRARDTPGGSRPSRTPVREVIEVVVAGQGHDGLGLALPGILLMALGGAIAAGVLRRTGSS